MKRALMRVVFVLIVLGTLLPGCTRRAAQVALPLEVPQTFTAGGGQSVSSRWWTVFNDRQLDALVDSALEFNFDLMVAFQRLEAAQAVVAREKSFLFPGLDAFLGGEKSDRGSSFEETERLELGMSASYEVDLWGRIRSAVDAERYRAKATLADYQTAAVSLSAEIVRNWYQLTEAFNQLQLVTVQVETNEKALELMQNRFGSGQVRGVDILRQQQLLESTRAQKIVAESRIGVLKHHLSVLLGQPPKPDFNFQYDSLPGLPPLPQTGIPMDLVRRRPDIQNAYMLLLAADRDLASAMSNRYPRLSLSASVSTAGNSADNLFKDWAYTLAGNLLAPVFYGGRLSAEVDRTGAVKNQLLYAYAQAVLVAFREVENALVQEQKQLESIKSLETQAELARRAYEQLRMEYFNGFGNYLDVLTALGQEQQLRRNLLSARLVLLEYRIALYRALAGGIDNSDE